MMECLDITATTDRSLKHIIGLAKAARNKGRKVMIFFTGSGVRLTQHPDFKQLSNLAEMAVCRTSLEQFGINPHLPIEGIPVKNVINQSWHSYLIDHTDRYMTL